LDLDLDVEFCDFKREYNAEWKIMQIIIKEISSVLSRVCSYNISIMQKELKNDVLDFNNKS
jgi:hypothetical protein